MENRSGRVEVDSETVLLLLEVPRSQIVFLSALIEGYDGLAVSKTIDESRGLVCLITTKDYEPECLRLLDSLKSEMPWRFYEGRFNQDEIFQYIER